MNIPFQEVLEAQLLEALLGAFLVNAVVPMAVASVGINELSGTVYLQNRLV
jgi:hypothetical protein